MPFSFSFTLTAPGLSNPFTAQPDEANPVAPQPRLTPLDARNDRQGHGSTAPARRRPPSPSLLPPLSRKRGWVPSSSEISCASASPTLTSGYLDTPAKYREMMAASNEDEIEEMVADLPPPKRRRTLAGSIVSTALSAALIGTAVGLTVYRLWRDRGKQPESLPPPPYEQGEWVPPKPDPSLPTSIPVTQVTPPTPRSRRTRHVAGRRGHTRHRKTYSRAAQASTSSLTSTPSTRAPIPPEFNFGVPPAEPEVEMDDQMSWIGDKLASLIAEGQRALGKEVVVMSEAREDEEDDGAEDWIEENQVRSRASSRRPSKLPRTSGLPSYSVSRHGSPLPSASPRRDTFDLSQSYNSSYAMSIPGSPRRRGREASVESDAFGSTSFREDESSWQTPELREAMERARMRYLQDRA